MKKLIRYLLSKREYFSAKIKIFLLSCSGMVSAGRGCRFDRRAVFDMEGMTDGSHLYMGDATHIKKFAIIAPRSGIIKIGSGVTINPFCFIYGYGGVLIGDNTRIASGCKIISFNHNFGDGFQSIVDQGNTAKGIEIGNNVWIGADAKILDGVNIGDSCVIGAGSVVTKSVPKNSVVAGNPARIMRTIV